MILLMGGIALFSAVRDYYSRDKLLYFKARIITSLAIAIGLIAIASSYFMDLMEESWTWIFSVIIGSGLGLLKVLIESVSRIADASRRRKLFIASTIGIAMIVVSALCFLMVIRIDYHGIKEVPTGTCHAILKAAGITH